MYFAPPWMSGSVILMSPTFSSAPVAGMICITPMAPTWLFAPWSRRRKLHKAPQRGKKQGAEARQGQTRSRDVNCHLPSPGCGWGGACMEGQQNLRRAC
jgi:hypothetical protein